MQNCFAQFIDRAFEKSRKSTLGWAGTLATDSNKHDVAWRDPRPMNRRKLAVAAEWRKLWCVRVG